MREGSSMVALQLALVTSALFGSFGAPQPLFTGEIGFHKSHASPRIAKAESNACNLAGRCILVATAANSRKSGAQVLLNNSTVLPALILCFSIVINNNFRRCPLATVMETRAQPLKSPHLSLCLLFRHRLLASQIAF